MSCALQASRVRLTCQGVRRLKPKNKSQGIQEPNLKPAQKENNPQPQPETRRRARVASSAAAASSTPSVTDCFPLWPGPRRVREADLGLMSVASHQAHEPDTKQKHAIWNSKHPAT